MPAFSNKMKRFFRRCSRQCVKFTAAFGEALVSKPLTMIGNTNTDTIRYTLKFCNEFN